MLLPLLRQGFEGQALGDERPRVALADYAVTIAGGAGQTLTLPAVAQNAPLTNYALMHDLLEFAALMDELRTLVGTRTPVLVFNRQLDNDGNDGTNG